MTDIETIADNISHQAAGLGAMVSDHMLKVSPRIVFRGTTLSEALALRVLLDRKHARSDDMGDPMCAEYTIGGVEVFITCVEKRAMRDGRIGGVGNMIEARDFAVPF